MSARSKSHATKNTTTNVVTSAATGHTKNRAAKRPDVTRLVWLDLEMTGLDPAKERIIEIALVVTDTNLHVVAEFPDTAIYQAPLLLSNMDNWNKRQHKASGLLERVRSSRISEQQAEWRALDFLKSHLPPQSSPLCGNTVHQDRRFLVKYMPELERYFHYRNLDVSTLKELSDYWRPDIQPVIQKERKHRALEDIKDSITELKVYRELFLR